MQRSARRSSSALKRAGRAGRVTGNREYNPGWHTALGPATTCSRSRRRSRARRIERKESRGGHFRDDFPRRKRSSRSSTSGARKEGSGRVAMRGRRRMPDSARCPRTRKRGREQDQRRRSSEVQSSQARPSRIWRGDRRAGRRSATTSRGLRGMVVLDAVHQIQADQAQRSRGALELQGRQVRLLLRGDQRQAAADVHDAARRRSPRRAGHGRADEGLPADQRPGHRRVLELRVKKTIKPFKPRQPDAPDGTWRMAQADVDRVQEFRKCIECFLCQDVCHVLRDHQQARRVHRPALPGLHRRARDAPARHRGPRRAS